MKTSRIKSHSTLFLFATFTALALVLSGCGGAGEAPLQGEYEKISVGMPITEVEGLLGTPTNSVEEISGMLKFWHLDGGHVITISIGDDGKVLSKDRGTK